MTDTIVYVTSSIISAIVTKTSIAPFERIKMLKQAQKFYNTNNYTSIYGSIKHMIANEGLLSTFKGNLTNIYRVVPNYVLKFPLNDIFKKYMSKDKLSYYDLLCCGTLSGLSQLFITYPMDFVRTRISLDNQMNSNNNSIRKCFVQMYKNEGLAACYKGLGSAVLSYPLYVGLQMSLYTTFKNDFENKFIAGALAGLISQTLMYPGDTLKRNLQLDGINGQKKKYSGILDCIKKILKKEGIKGFYPGVKVNILKSIPGAAIQFSVYDYCAEYGIKFLYTQNYL